eukprot:g2692.t1
MFINGVSLKNHFPLFYNLRTQSVKSPRKFNSASNRKIHRTSTRRRRRSSVWCVNDVNWDAYGGNPDPYPQISSSQSTVRQFDFLVVGSGLAGLSYALKVAEYGKVGIITKKMAADGCTKHAQGGVCAVLDPLDSVEDHIRDTMIAGVHLNNRQVVEVVCKEGPSRVMELVELGANFTRKTDGSLHLTREGGHSGRRIVHAADATGREIENTFLRAVTSHKNITIFEHHSILDLVVEDVFGMPHCFGADVLDEKTNRILRFISLTTMLASGGAGQVYPYTTNPGVVTGDGIAIAHRAKARVANMEFVQFHPTSLYTKKRNSERVSLITEAVRGEGGMLLNLKGERFMSSYDPRMELAPRDVVARAIQDQLLSHGQPYVLLDISHKPRDFILSHFPNIALTCIQEGIDITSEAIPVVPAQHYLCGGVQTGLLGETSIQGLYACGEVACTGLHGANRLASNSLLEALVFAHRAAEPSIAHAEHALRHCGRQIHYVAASAEFSNKYPLSTQFSSEQESWIQRMKTEFQSLMWEHCGIVRSHENLSKTLPKLAAIYLEVKGFIKKNGVSVAAMELLNMVTVGELIVFSAFQRRESRGLHYVRDFPNTEQAEMRSTIIQTSLRKRHGLNQHSTHPERRPFISAPQSVKGKLN